MIIEEEIEIGPRKVTRTSGSIAIYLGKRFKRLVGKYVVVRIKVLKDEQSPP